MKRFDDISGFTLIETMIALAVFAIGSLGVLFAINEQSKNMLLIENKTIATWIAENTITEMRATKDISKGNQNLQFANREWVVRTTQESSGLTEVEKVTVSVSLIEASAGEEAHSLLTAYLAANGE